MWVRFPPGVPFSPGMLTHTRSLLYSRRGRRNNVTRLRLAANNRCSVAALLTIPAGSTIFAGYADAYPIFCVNAPRYSRGVYTIHIHRLCRWILIYRAICRKNSIKNVGVNDMHPKSWTAFGGAYFYVKEKEIQHKILARV